MPKRWIILILQCEKIFLVSQESKLVANKIYVEKFLG